jgi:glycosyltransferase involved in cell wall biosynthesis
MQAEFVYLNSMFSKYFTIFPLLAGKAKKNESKYFLSPRGMLRTSALQFKPVKKKLFLYVFRWLNYHKRIEFVAADQTELEDIKRFFGNTVPATILPNFSGAIAEQPVHINKHPGALSIISIGRIHPVKNLDYLLNVLKKVKSDIRLTIIGSLEDLKFWDSCKQIISGLPENISVSYQGERPNHELAAIVSTHHIFALATKGENFGHAIAEALNLGRPVLISDQTPWRNLENEKAGWDLSLQHPELFVSAIEKAAAFTQSEYDIYVKNAWDFANKKTDKDNLAINYKLLFS